jgi:hypothetical protein
VRREPAVRSLLLALLATGALVAPAPPARAEGSVTGAQAHFRAGLLSGSYSTSDSSLAGSYSVATTFDLEYEAFLDARGSFLLRATFAQDLATSRLMYSYAGVGRRWYFGSTGMATSSQDGTVQAVILPRWRYFAGGDLGVSQVVVKTFGTVLQANSALVELGGHVGTIYQVSRSVGIEAYGGATLGLGFSAIAVGARSLRAFLGASYYF